MSEKPFVPKRAEEADPEEGMRDLDFSENWNRAQVINSLNNLRSDLKGTDVSDYKKIFEALNPEMIEAYKSFLLEMVVIWRSSRNN